MKNKVLFIFSMCFLLSANISFAAENPQQRTVTVTVRDDSGPVVGAIVTLQGTSNSGTTNTNGVFSMPGVSPDASIEVQMVGYESQTIPVGNRNQIEVTLQSDAKTIDQVVVVGYGTLRRSEVTAAVASLTAEEFTQTAANSSVLEMAKGKMPGVMITNAYGTDPREGTSIQVRGAGSMNSNNSPLIVIDGVSDGDLSLVRPEDVESFSVLKDASAAAIYGTRGANGVVLITTKRGKGGVQKARFEYTGFVSHEYIYRQPEVLSAQEYRDYMKSGGYLANQMVDLSEGEGGENWSELLTNKSNISHSHSLSMTGGNAKTSYRMTGYFRDADPIAIESDQENWGTRINVNHLGLNDKLEIIASLSADFRKRNQIGERGAWEQVAQRNPTENARDEKSGEWLEDAAYNSWNPLARYENKEDYSNRTTVMASGTARYHITDGLTASLSGAWQQHDNVRRQYLTRDSKQSEDDLQGGGRAQRWWSGDVRKTLDATIEYTKLFNDVHSVNAVGGYSYQYHMYENFDAWNSGFLTDAFTYNHLGNGTGTTKGTSYANMGSDKRDDKLAAFFIRGNYVYDGKYQFSATYRREGSSRFGANNRWGNFWAISGGWVVSREEFMQGFENLDNLKIRLGYGVTGRMPSNDYEYMALLGTGGQYPINGTWYQTWGLSRNPNPNLKWEQKGEWNLGIDASFYGGRIGGSVDLYSRKTVDLLGSRTTQLPGYLRDNIYTNVGTIINKGIEVGINAVPVEKDNFSWNVNATFSYGYNKLVSLSNNTFKATYQEFGGLPSPGNLGNAIRTQEGGPLGEFYGYRFAGLDENGKWLFYDQNNNVIPSSAKKESDKAYIGNGTPKFYASLGNTFRYRNFDLAVFFRGKFGYQILNMKEMYFGNLTWLPNNVLNSALTKHKDLRDIAVYSDYYLENGSFVKLDNITLGYNVKLKSDKWVSKLRIYAAMENVATITGYSGVTPEVQDTGLTVGMDERGFFPTTTTMIFGINIGF